MKEFCHRWQSFGLRGSQLAIVACLLAAGVHGTAFAQANDSESGATQTGQTQPTNEVRVTERNDPGMIVVTARRRDENIQDVPVAVSAFGADRLDALGIQRIADLDSYTPGLAIDPGSNGNGASYTSSIFIRGIGQNDWAITFEPGVGIYFDGVYFGRLTGNVLDVVDIAEVEVLRGPQGTLFGKNAIGGAITMRSQRPSGAFGGFVNVEGGSYNEINVNAALEFPVTDTLSARFAGSSRNRDGIGESLATGEDLGNVNRLFGRGTLLWEPSDRATVTLIGDWSKADEAPRPQHLLTVNPLFTGPGVLNFWNGAVAPTVGDGTRFFDPSFITEGKYDNFQGDPLLSRFEAWGVSLAGNFELSDNITLDSVTGYRDFKADLWADYDTTFLPYNGIRTTDNQNQFSQEVRLSGTNFDDRLDWVTGLFYYREELDQPLYLRFFQGLGFAEVDQRATQVSDSYAAFAHGIWEFSPMWSTSLGVRYTRDHKDFEVMSRSVLTDPNTPPPSVVVADLGEAIPPTVFNRIYENVSLEAGIQFRPSENFMVYSSFRQGYKSGGFNNRAANLVELTSFDNENVDAYEIGFKSQSSDNRIIFNVAAYYNDYKDLQFDFEGPPPPGGGDAPNLVDNAGSVAIYGVEVESVARPSDFFTLNASLAWTEAEIRTLDDRILNQSTNNIGLDNRLPKTPKWKLNLGGLLEYPVTGLGTFSLRGDAGYTSSSFPTIENSPYLQMESTTMINARIAFESESGGWEIYGEGQNLLDERVITSGLDALNSQGFIVVNYSDPMMWRIGVNYRF